MSCVFAVLSFMNLLIYIDNLNTAQEVNIKHGLNDRGKLLMTEIGSDNNEQKSSEMKEEKQSNKTTLKKLYVAYGSKNYAFAKTEVTRVRSSASRS